MRIIVITILMIITSLIYAQDRVNRKELKFANKTKVLSKATGWAYNQKLGEWIDYENVISDDKDYKTKYKILQGRTMMSKYSKNFINMQFKLVAYEKKLYYVLVLTKWVGSYKYPNIKEDWRSWKRTYGYIYTQSEYEKIKSLNGGQTIELKTKKMVSMGGLFEKYNEKKFLDLIQTELASEDKMVSNYIFPITQTVSESKVVIRFFVPELTSKYSFKESYFETTPADFSKLKM